MKIPEKTRFKGKYDPKLKIAIAREYLTTDLGYGSLGKKYSIHATTIKEFVKWYNKKYPDGRVEDAGLPGASELPGKDLQEANLKIAALEMLIENAGKELGVDLVKKFGTKQPKK